jgi:hypothetical protein
MLPAVIVRLEYLLNFLSDSFFISLLISMLLKYSEYLACEFLVIHESFLNICGHSRLFSFAVESLREHRLVHKSTCCRTREFHLCFTAQEGLVSVLHTAMLLDWWIVMVLRICMLKVSVSQGLLSLKTLTKGVLTWT